MAPSGSFVQVGVGSQVDLSELYAIASAPSNYTVFLATNYSTASAQLSDRLAAALCYSASLDNHFLLKNVYVLES